MGSSFKIDVRVGLPASSSEDQPAVEGGSPPFASTARLYPEIGRSALDYIAKADLLVRDKPR
jgi:hypothetical protein